MIRALALTLVPALMIAQAPAEPPVPRGWVRNGLKLGQLRCLFDTPALLSPDQDHAPTLEGLVDLEKSPLRKPGEPITVGITLFRALFDLPSPFLGLPQGQLEVIVFLGGYTASPGSPDPFEAFARPVQSEFHELFQSGRNPQRLMVLEDFHRIQVDQLPALGLRLRTDGIETWHHLVPGDRRHFIDFQFRFLARPKADAKELARLRDLATDIFRTVRFRRVEASSDPKLRE